MESEIINLLKSYFILKKNFYSMVISDFIFTPYTSAKKIANLFLILLQHYLIKGERVIGYPIKIVVDPTNYCNLRCPLCPTGRGDPSRPKGFMKFETFRKIVDELYEYLFVIDFYNWGEPLLSKDVFRMINYAHSKKVKTRMSSNITLLSEEKAKEMVESGLDVLIASIDGASEDTYKIYRVGGDFKKVMKNLETLVKVKDELRAKNPQIIWQFVVMKHNEHEIEKAKEFAKKLGVKLKLTPTRVDMGLELTQDMDYSIKPSAKWFSKKIIRYFNGSKIIKPKNCLFLWTQVVINPDGSVSPCCGSYNKKDDMGNILSDGGVLKTWNNEKFRYARRVVRNKIQNANIICVNCLKNGFLESN